MLKLLIQKDGKIIQEEDIEDLIILEESNGNVIVASRRLFYYIATANGREIYKEG